MSYQSYVSVDDFATNSMGADLSGISTPELSSLLITASLFADSYTQTSWQYQTIQHEQHDWPEDMNQRWEAYPYYSPIRTVTGLIVGVTIAPNSGDYVNFTIPTTPIGTSTNPPQVFGQVWIDRSRGFVQTVYTMLRYVLAAAYPALQMQPMQILLDYTCGYDNGTVQADGYSFPYPQWLIEATRIIAYALMGERALGQQGMTGVEMARFGDITIRRGTGPINSDTRRPGSSLAIPETAKLLLNPHIRGSIR